VRTQADIDARVARLLRDLGNPPPPLDLQQVRALLELDRTYYTSGDDGFLAQIVSKMKVAGKQVIRRPSILKEVITKFDLRSLLLPDQKRILLDRSVPEKKHRWLEAHEIAHDLLPWHGSVMFGDTDHTVTPACHQRIESEANFTAGRLLFLRDRFTEEVRSRPIRFAEVKALQTVFGNTLTSTLWRYVENIFDNVPLLGVITCHPHKSRRPEDFKPADPCRYFIQSPAFARMFSQLSEVEVFGLIQEYCGAQRGGVLGEAEVTLRDDNGTLHVFVFETFFNHYEALTLGAYARKAVTMVAVP
jgi:hypothetical protein